jgi:hypothetical protein
MAEIVNLRLARKAKRRTEQAQAANAARAKSGVTKAEREVARLDKARAERVLDGARLEKGEE